MRRPIFDRNSPDGFPSAVVLLLWAVVAWVAVLLVLALVCGRAKAGSPPRFEAIGPGCLVDLVPRIFHVPVYPWPEDTPWASRYSAGLAEQDPTCLFASIRREQSTLDYWHIRLTPLEGFDWLRWDGTLELYSATDTVRCLDVVLATGCRERWEGCRPYRPAAGTPKRFADLEVPMGRGGPRIEGYVGTRAGAIRPDQVRGIQWRVSP